MPSRGPIRVLRLISRLNAGGPARHVVWLAEGLASRGYETRLAAGRVPEGEDDLSSFARERGVAVTELPRLSRELNALADWRSLSEMESLIEEYRPDLVHTHTAKAGFLGRWAARRCNRRRLRAGQRPIRVIHTFHGNVLSGYFSPAKTLLYRALERHMAHHSSDAIVVPSPQQRQEIAERFRIAPAEKVSVIPLAVDLSAFERLPEPGGFRREMGLVASDFVVGIVGRIAPIKNHELFLQSAAVIAREVRNARFIVVGSGKGLEGLVRLAGDLGISDRIRFAGVRTDLPAIYADLDVVALTSRNEGTPLSLVEAMAAGKPIVATDVGGVRDLLTAEWTGDVAARRFALSESPRGLLVESADASAFAQAVIRVVRDGTLARQLAEAGRAYAFRAHGLQRLFDDLDRIYRILLDQ
ncbi:MAG TPA: glycosyltransferase [Thermoanaerobaculia bacterium]|nr:glycosyltransferase [Thermoanaerobaculia bacterium]